MGGCYYDNSVRAKAVMQDPKDMVYIVPADGRTTCPYCHSVLEWGQIRCASCGAPRKETK